MQPTVASLLEATPASVASRFASDSLLARLARPLVNRIVPDGATTITVRSGPGRGLRLVIDARSEKYYWTGRHEPEVQEALSTLLLPGLTFWDVGAHVGFFSQLACRLVGETGSVHAFEPTPASRERLEQAAVLNQVSNLTVHPFALASDGRSRSLFLDDSSSKSTLNGSGRVAVEVPCRSLDRLAEQLGPPHVIKIDVEGAELEVLGGGRGLLATERPALVVEFHDDGDVGRAQALLRHYSFQPLSRRHWLLRARPGGAS